MDTHNQLAGSDDGVLAPVDDRRAIGGWLLVAVGAWLGLGSVWIYPTSVVGQLGSVRDALIAVVVVGAGLRIRLGNAPSLVASGLAVLAGLLLLAFGLILSHSSWGAQAQEITCGLLVLVGAAISARR